MPIIKNLTPFAPAFHRAVNKIPGMAGKFLINIFYLSLTQPEPQSFISFTYPFPVYMVAVLIISEMVIVN